MRTQRGDVIRIHPKRLLHKRRTGRTLSGGRPERRQTRSPDSPRRHLPWPIIFRPVFQVFRRPNRVAYHKRRAFLYRGDRRRLDRVANGRADQANILALARSSPSRWWNRIRARHDAMGSGRRCQANMTPARCWRMGGAAVFADTRPRRFVAPVCGKGYKMSPYCAVLCKWRRLTVRLRYRLTALRLRPLCLPTIPRASFHHCIKPHTLIPRQYK